MAIDLIPAMTGAEIRGNTPLPSKIAWLSCHFSPWNAGLSNLPEALPEGSVLILDDSTPPCGHDPGLITAQLRDTLTAHKCQALLLDFQRRGDPAEAELAALLTRALDFPVGISEKYAGALPGPVFLPPIPPDRPADDYLRPWQSREIWLDVSPEGLDISLTEQGADFSPLPAWELPAGIVHRDTELLCHYTIEVSDTSARFRLCRTQEDLEALVTGVQALGVTKCFTLWQEWNRN